MEGWKGSSEADTEESNMPTIDDQMALGDIVTAHPSVARELERMGLDYCCHGQRALGLAVADAGLDLDEVQKRLESALVPGEAPDWANLDAAELAAHVESTHHKYMWDEMPRLSQLVDKIVEVHGANHPELTEVQALYAKIRVSMEPHMRREELMVFPAMRRLEAGQEVKITAGAAGGDSSLTGRIKVLVEEHDEAGELLERLREVTGGYQTPADGCNTYRATYEGLEQMEADLHLHIHKENNILFPEAIRMEEAAQAKIA